MYGGGGGGGGDSVVCHKQQMLRSLSVLHNPRDYLHGNGWFSYHLAHFNLSHAL